MVLFTLIPNDQVEMCIHLALEMASFARLEVLSHRKERSHQVVQVEPCLLHGPCILQFDRSV